MSGTGYLSEWQIAVLLEPIMEHRVGKDGKGFSHVEAYELRAHLNRVFGFGRWSQEVLEQECIFEEGEQKTGKKGPYTAWTVCYRSLVRLTVCAPDGTALATYTEGATGDATNQPSRADAHDLSLKTSESQAFKRCCANLGDQFGLSLYRKGSMIALVGKTLVGVGKDDTPAEDIQRSAPPTFREPDPEPPRPEVPTTPPGPSPAPAEQPAPRKTLAQWRDELLAATDKSTVRHLLRDISMAGMADTETADANGAAVTFADLATSLMKALP